MHTRTLIAMWVLVAISCGAALVGFAFVSVSFALAQEWFVAYPHCNLPFGDLSPIPPLEGQLHTAWLLSGVAGLLSWSCAFVARGIASVAPLWARRTTSTVLMFSSLAIVGCALAFGWYQGACYALRLA
ncbi:MAG TPA: hypothetical protein VF510_07805 [Ktedonobacterales bacterium]